MPEPTVYPSWEHAPIHLLRARSYFYHLQPAAVGSAQVESLTSYLMRLAEAHDVTPGILLTKELLPRVREAFRRHAYRPAGKPISTFLYDAHTLNGVAQCAHDWIGVLESLTGVGSLQSLTMLTWGRVFSERGLLRHYRAWCPCCFEGWRSANTPVHEPLLWSISEASVCPVHDTLLEDRCPHCEQNLHVISAKSQPGHCGRCRHWLGRRAVPDPSTDRRAQVVAANSVGELLSAAPKLAHMPSREQFLYNLRFCIEDLADGNMSRFAAATDISFDAMFDWSLPSRLVRLNLLFRICSLLGISPLRFITQRIAKDDLDCEHIRRVIAQKTSHIRIHRTTPQLRSVLERVVNEETTTVSLRDVATELGYRSIQSLRLREPDLCARISGKCRARIVVRRTTQPHRSFPAKSIVEDALTRALLQPVLPPLRTIAKTLGFRSDASLYVRFPDLCSAFAKRAALCKQRKIDACRGPVAAAVAETPPPTLKDVARRIGCTVCSLRYRFPDLCAELVARLPEQKLFLHQQQAAIIRLALAEEPVPAIESVAVRLGMTAPYLRRLHPDLYAQIRKRHTERRNALAANKRAAFRAEIRAAVLNLSQRGIVPSRKRVFASITNPSMRSTQILDHQIAATKL